jgi:hypothetical protein
MPIISFICARANRLATVDPAKIKAPTLLLYAPTDLVFYEPIVRETMQKIAEAGGSVDGVSLSGRTAISTACSQSDRRAMKSRRFWHGDTAAHAIILPIKKLRGRNRPRSFFVTQICAALMRLRLSASPPRPR